MPVTVTVDYRAFKARMARMRKDGASGREGFVLAMAAAFAQNVVKLSPIDTHRYVRGWMEAARGAGVRVGALPPIVNSRKKDQIAEALVKQVNLTRKREGSLINARKLWYEDANRPRRGYYFKLERKIQKAGERARRAEEELQKFLQTTGGIAMMRGSGAALNGYQRMITADALNLTVRDKIYGGRGRILKGGAVTGVMLHNLEPHCRVVEKYRRPVARAKAALSAAGLQKLKPEYVKRLAANTKTMQRVGGALRRNGVI